MITFFRKIRKNLLAEGSTSKYLKYSIGEILLVVIGILIALQINNWNEDNNERKVEVDYIQNVLEDLEDDLEIFQNYQESNQKIYSLIDSIIPNLKHEDRRENIAHLAFWSRMITMEWLIIHPVERTYEQMKSSGHLRLIKDKSVADGISKYYNSITTFDGYNEAGMLWAEDYVESIGKIFDAELLRRIMLERSLQEAKPSDLLSEDPIVINQMINSLQYFNGALILGEQVSLDAKKKASDLISLINNTYDLE
jgi:predicted choloylglycine hydrolase